MRVLYRVLLFSIIVALLSIGPNIYTEQLRPSGHRWIADEEIERTDVLERIVTNDSDVVFQTPLAYEMQITISSTHPVSIFCENIGLYVEYETLFHLSRGNYNPGTFTISLMTLYYDYGESNVTITIKTWDFRGHFEQYFDWGAVLNRSVLPAAIIMLGAGVFGLLFTDAFISKEAEA